MTIEELNKNLLEAAKQGDIEGVKKVLEQGTDVNARNKDGRTAMIEAARWGASHTRTAGIACLP